MSQWDATTFDAKDNLLSVVRTEAEGLFALAERPDAWTAPTACTEWEVRDIVGHMVDTTESYFVSFDAARGAATAADPLGVRVFQDVANQGAQAFRSLSQDEMMQRLRGDFAKMMETFQGLGPDEWGGLMVPHKYMGPLPAFFYPVFQLMDYGVHSWDIRQGGGKAHGLSGDTADLLAPFMFILWQATIDQTPGEQYDLGVRVLGHADYRVSVGPEGLQYATGDVSDLPATIEFDPGSLVLTAFGRINAGTVRGDRGIAERFLNQFFRI
ncbi:MAG TPA: maleylpyruvate isomerase family mycothiol-dependent enzyme [Streptosporangiaceae bacterium]|nr:maleylpyruvate isomerase family mycothiol-dependent enzyme [Streptosporangiaceae bacterium]